MAALPAIAAQQDGSEQHASFAGQKVKVTGSVVGKTIRVTAIEATS